MTASNGELMQELLDGKQLLVFDFDGTLADTSSFHATAFNKVLAPWELSVDYSTIAGMRTRDALALCFAKANVNVSQSQIQQLTQVKQTFVRALISKELLPLPGVDEFLRWARPRYHLAMYSSGSRKTVMLAMEKLGFFGWFDPILCAEDVVHAKPDPEGFLKILDLVCIDSKNALVFEDSDAGIEAAEGAGIATFDVRVIPFDKVNSLYDLSFGC